jgi:hypothetical protein
MGLEGRNKTPPSAKLPPPKNRNAGAPQPQMPVLTAAGEKAVAAYDPFKSDPVFHCDPVAVARVWQAPSTPLEVVRNGNASFCITNGWTCAGSFI